MEDYHARQIKEGLQDVAAAILTLVEYQYFRDRETITDISEFSTAGEFEFFKSRVKREKR
jgi:hypothetical protein